MIAAGCSVHPIPDDVSPIPSEEIVRSMRCEAKLAVRNEIKAGLVRLGLGDIDPDSVLDKRNLDRVRAVRRPGDPSAGRRVAMKFVAYSMSTMAYAFEFDITENNDASAEVGFNVPFLPTGKGDFGLNAKGNLNRIRQAKRVFVASETFGELRRLSCGEPIVVRDGNLIYPITGSIGMMKVVHTFVELAEMGGFGNSSKPEDNVFTDTLTFTTAIGGSLTPTLTLKPVPREFRVVSATGTFGASRIDKHQVTISLTFPTFTEVQMQVAKGSVGQLSDPESAKARALENLCIARAKAREDEFGTLRLIPPEASCALPRQGQPPVQLR
jgi:hypothetical protein